MKSNLLSISKKCQELLTDVTLEGKQKDCNLLYQKFLNKLGCYPMENCFNFFYMRLYEDFLFRGIYLSCESGDMQYMLHSLCQGNRIGVMNFNWVQSFFDQSINLVKIILALAGNDLELLEKIMPKHLGAAKNGTYFPHYNMIMAMIYKDFTLGNLAEEQIKCFLKRKQNRFDRIFSFYLIELYNRCLDEASVYLQEMCTALTRVNWVQEDVFLSTSYYALGRTTALFIHGAYHLAYYYLERDEFLRIRMPVHKTFIREYEEFNIQNNFRCGGDLIDLDNGSRFMKHCADIDIIPTVSLGILELNGKIVLNAKAFHHAAFLNMKQKNLIDFEMEEDHYVFKAIW